MIIGSWQQLASEFAAEIKGVWFELYPSSAYIDRIIKKTYHYYDMKKDRTPKNRQEWARAIAKFLETNWSEQERRHGSVKSILDTKTGVQGPIIRERIKCDICLDSTVIQVEQKSGLYTTLMLCACTDTSDPSNWKMERWTEHWKEELTPSRCPMEWFVPNSRVHKDDLVKAWTKRCKEAEKFWNKIRDQANVEF